VLAELFTPAGVPLAASAVPGELWKLQTTSQHPGKATWARGLRGAGQGDGGAPPASPVPGPSLGVSGSGAEPKDEGR